MSAESTLSVLTAQPAVAALRERGLDPGPALAAARLSAEALESVDNRLPHVAVRDLWEAAASLARDPSFGVHVAQALPAGAYNLFDYLLAVSETVGAGLERLTRYIRLLHDRSSLQLVSGPQHASVIRHVAAPAPHYDEFSLTLLLLRSQHASGVKWTPERMTFQHRRTQDDGELERVFGCPLVFGAPEVELRFPASTLALPHRQPDSRLLSILTGYADSLLGALPAHGSLLTRVSVSIAQRFAKGLPTLAETAAAVRLPERTLQRQLAAEGTSHSALVDQVRRNLALKHIGNASLSVAEIAYLLHFTDSTAFHRAFKRWTGETPTLYRKRLYG